MIKSRRMPLWYRGRSALGLFLATCVWSSGMINYGAKDKYMKGKEC